LFCARTDVSAARWENARAGAAGWMPAVAGGWCHNALITTPGVPAPKSPPRSSPHSPRAGSQQTDTRRSRGVVHSRLAGNQARLTTGGDLIDTAGARVREAHLSGTRRIERDLLAIVRVPPNS
jgi:hypothetical protein